MKIKVQAAGVLAHSKIVRVAKSSKYTSAFSHIMFSSPEHYARQWIWQASIGDHVVGFACIRNKTRTPETNVYFIGTLPTFQGRGVASALLKAIMKQSPTKRVVLKVAIDNKKAIEFYKRFGFKATRMDKKYLYVYWWGSGYNLGV